MDSSLILFRIDQFNCALPIEYDPYCFRAVKIQSIPIDVPFFQGTVDFHGSNIPVFNLRKKFSLPAKDLNPRQTMIKLRTRQNYIIIIADTVAGFTRVMQEEINPITGVNDTALPFAASFFRENEKYLLLNFNILIDGEDLIAIDSIYSNVN